MIAEIITSYMMPTRKRYGIMSIMAMVTDAAAFLDTFSLSLAQALRASFEELPSLRPTARNLVGILSSAGVAMACVGSAAPRTHLACALVSHVS